MTHHRIARAVVVLTVAAAATLTLRAVPAPQATPRTTPASAAGRLTIDKLIDIKHPSAAQWSADGKTVTFSWDRAGVVTRHVVKADGTSPPVPLAADASAPAGGAGRRGGGAGGGAANAAAAQGAVTSRDGRRVAYVGGSEAGGSIEIRVRNADGSNDVKVAAVVGFPLGATDSDAKRFETETLIDLGAQEIDLVLPIGLLKDGDDKRVLRELRDVVEAADGAAVKVILETCLLTRDEKIRACGLAVEAGAKFVKTSTGFSTGGATLEDILLMRERVGPKFGEKASGGFRDTADAGVRDHAFDGRAVGVAEFRSEQSGNGLGLLHGAFFK